MALINTNINYSGKDINMIMQECFADTLFHKKFGARVVESIKSKYFWFDISNSIELQSFQSCPTTGFDDFTLNQNSKQLCEFMALANIDHNAVIATAREIYYKKGVLNEKIMDDSVLFNALLESMMKTIANQWDDIILNGDTAGATGTYLDLCDGFLTQWAADADVIDQPGVLANITASGIVTELNKIINAIPDCFRYGNAERIAKIGLSMDMFKAYEQFLMQTGGFNPGLSLPTNAGFYSFMGLEIVPLFYLPAGTAFATWADNLMLVYDDATDFANLKVIDKSLYSSCDQLEIKLGARGGITYGYGSDIVYYVAV